MNNGTNRRIRMAAFAAGLLIVAVIGAVLYRSYRATHISTDDAYVEGYVHTVAPKVSGTVKAVYVADNQHVRAGDLLVELDSIDYEVRVRETASSLRAEELKRDEMGARVEAAEKQVLEVRAAVDAAKANVALAQANLAQARIDAERYTSLYARGAIPKERKEKVQTAYEVQAAELKAALEQQRRLEASSEVQAALVRQARAALAGQEATIRNKAALTAGSELNRSYTRIVSPVEGYVTRKTVEKGNQVAVGTPLLAIVPLDDVWVVANYKETQVRDVKRGQRVIIKADTYQGRTFRGRVDSMMAGTGSVFSLFPPENATGNYVKVVQRIPVKIVLDRGENSDHLLRVGMSVVPTILIE